jgi:hypothetical protein
MTPAEHRRSLIPVWVGFGLVVVGLAIFVAAVSVSTSDNSSQGQATAGVVFFLGFLVIVVGAIVLLVRRAFGVRGRVHDVLLPGYPGPLRALDLYRVHPNFVAAVGEMYVERARQIAAAAAAASPAYG